MKEQQLTVIESKPKSVLMDMASRFGMEPKNFEATLKATVVPANVSNEQFAAFLLVAKEYNLNPLTKEIYAFPARTGGIQPIVSIDGWVRIVNNHPQLDGITFDDVMDNGNIAAITCNIFRKDRTKAISVTEYLTECRQATEPWKKWPIRMLRHKALIQCARYAFGFSGIVDPDEAERLRDVTPRDNAALVDAIKGAAANNMAAAPGETPKNKLDELLSNNTLMTPNPAKELEIETVQEVIPVSEGILQLMLPNGEVLEVERDNPVDALQVIYAIPAEQQKEFSEKNNKSLPELVKILEDKPAAQAHIKKMME